MQVADDAEVRELEDRRVRVLVDRDDRLRALHADLVLDRAGDAAGDVERRRDRLAGLPDLGRVRIPAGVDDRAGRGDRAAERLRELLDAARTSPARRGRGRRRRSRSRPRSTGRSPPRAPARPSPPRASAPAAATSKGSTVPRRGLLRRVERAGAEEADPRRRLPADVDDDRVAERRLLADEARRRRRRCRSAASSGRPRAGPRAPRRCRRRGSTGRRARSRFPSPRRAARSRRRAAAGAAPRASASSAT